MKKLKLWIAGLVLAVGSVGSVVMLHAQAPGTSVGGVFEPIKDYVVGGVWTFTNAAPLITYNLTGFLKGNGSTAVTAVATTGSGSVVLATAPTVASPVVTGDAASGMVVSKTCAFVEDATMTTSTCTIVIPAGATLVDVVATSSVLWTKASSRLIVGDAQTANGWFLSTNLNSTDLVVGEALRAAGGIQAWGGLNGAYLVSASGVFGQATSTRSGPYYTSAGVVIGVVTVTPGAGTAGRTFLTVTYSVGQVTAPVVA